MWTAVSRSASQSFFAAPPAGERSLSFRLFAASSGAASLATSLPLSHAAFSLRIRSTAFFSFSTMVLVATPITATPAAGPPGTALALAAAAAFFFFSLCHWSRSHSRSAPSGGSAPGLCTAAQLCRCRAFCCRIAVTSTGVLALTTSSFGNLGIGRMLT